MDAELLQIVFKPLFVITTDCVNRKFLGLANQCHEEFKIEFLLEFTSKMHWESQKMCINDIV